MMISTFVFLLFGTVSVILATDVTISLDNTKVFAPTAYNNKLYYISRSVVTGFSQAIDWCSQNGGGYVAEIDTPEELVLLEGFVSRSTVKRVYVAGSDSKSFAKWISQRNGATVNVFDWTPGEPNNYGGDENCIEMGNNGKMNNIKCINPVVSPNVLCEKDMY